MFTNATEGNMNATASKPHIFKVYLLNVNSIGTLCGYGESIVSHEEAVQDALQYARRRDPNAYYDGRQVCFSARVVL
ncbi:MAG: hypothetical protein H7Z19_08230 [Chitinophagaceae bacterium]|nr:hypothetical protein [Rubrivivax sp.]